MKIVVSGAGGLLGGHAAAHIHARNCAARYRAESLPFDLVCLDHIAFADPDTLAAALVGADAVLHFAGVNRGADELVEQVNWQIAEQLAAACRQAGAIPHIVYANSTHAATNTPYGRGKRRAAEILSEAPGGMTNLVLPHIFGEGARPYYNNVTATFVDCIIKGAIPEVDPNGNVRLMHAGAAAEAAIEAALQANQGDVSPPARHMPVPELLERLREFHAAYSNDIFPDLSDPFDVALFNTYRTALYPQGFPREIGLNTDRRGTLFEGVKGGGGGSTFLSWTMPGVTRGDHFHLGKVERFLVLSGEAIVRIRRVLNGALWEYRVNGQLPAYIDMPTLHTHSIENVGNQPLLTLFWTNEIFDPHEPDTYFDPVLGVSA